MNFPPPTERQARLLWMSLTALAVAAFAALICFILWAVGWMLNRLAPVLLPLAVAAIIAYILDPVIVFLEKRKVPRMRAIILVFALGVVLVLAALFAIVPRLVAETGLLIERAPTYFEQSWRSMGDWLEKSPLGLKARETWESEAGDAARKWLGEAAGTVSGWLLQQLKALASWVGMLIGLALVPVYAFYFLLNKQAIEKRWREYLPLQESRFKEEAVFLLQSINDSLIVFFRGQVLVAICIGVLLTIGFWLMGLNYAVLLGLVAGALAIIPFIGAILGVTPAIVLAAIQFDDWLHPLIVLGIYCAVQLMDSLLLSPRIIGGRVGLHPVAVIIALMLGSALLGGILGGILAIPLAAVLRAVLNRYVWDKPLKAK